jgi:hypothetical protein
MLERSRTAVLFAAARDQSAGEIAGATRGVEIGVAEWNGRSVDPRAAPPEAR